MIETLTLRPGAVSLEQLEDLYWRTPSVVLDPACRAGAERSVEIIAAAAKGDKPVYGVNTGFGKLASTRISAGDVETLQRNLIRSHCSGVGPALSTRLVRLMMALKLISLGRGASGVRWVVIETIEAMLAKDVTPVIPSQGSVGASGDLAPLAHMAAVMMGEGEAEVNGERHSGAAALEAANIPPITLGPKEGLALINGTQFSTAHALAGLFEAWRCAMTSLVTGALSTDAIMGSTAPFRKEIHTLRGHQGQIDAARSIRVLMDGSEIRETHRDDDDRVQDPYCVRCQPQVTGAIIDLLRNVAMTLQIEANAATDNPLIVVEDGAIISGGNFHAEPVAFAADQIALAVAEIGSISQRRIALIVDPTLSFGLPAFLSPRPGLNSGFMIAEVTAAALMSENKQRAAPCSVDSTPTSANQEDHVSMAAHGARRLIDMTTNLVQIVGIELLTGAQGVELRAPLKTSQPLQNVLSSLRSLIPALGDDRILSGDLAAAAELVHSNAMVSAAGQEFFPTLADNR